jgi:mannitol 2-dehydrogenase
MTDLFGTTLANSSDFEEAFDRALDKLETKGVFAALGETWPDEH